MHFYRDPCPLLFSLAKKKEFNQKAKQDYFGAAPNVFVGRFGYPKVNVGILNTEEYNNNDAPLVWSKGEHTINDILGLRLSLINSNFKTSIKSFNDRFLQTTQEVSLARKPVDVEINLTKKPHFQTGSITKVARPHGPTIKLKKARITENPKVPTKVDKVVSDTDFKAAGALTTLFSRGFDEHYLTKLLSAGNLGVKTQRKLVPTRFSITAVDSTLSKNYTTTIQDYPETGFLLFFGNYFGNYYFFLFFPGVWSYELFESYTPFYGKTNFKYTTDYEGYKGRKYYAENCAGGYYSVRLAIGEKLMKMKRRASVLALRFITNEYTAHLGVWVTREASRKAFNAKPIEFSSKEELLSYTKSFIKDKFGIDPDFILKSSKLLNEMNIQMRLQNFFT